MNTVVLKASVQQKQAMMAHYDRYRQDSKNPYIEAFFNVIDWNAVAKNYEAAK